jgi:ABC-type Fe3+ transport system substrate-binding protein
VVYWSSGMSPAVFKAVEEGFKRKYGLKEFQVVSFPMRTTEIVAKVTQELKVGRLTVDTISGGIPVFYYQLLKAGELMRYDSPEYKQFENIGGWNEPGYWVMSNGYTLLMMWNPKHLKKGLTIYSDLLDPQLKGKMCSGDAKNSDSVLLGYCALRKILNEPTPWAEAQGFRYLT